MAATTWSATVATSGGDHTSINDAVAALAAGDTIYVKKGTYTGDVDVSKAVYIYVEPGTAFTSANPFVISGTKAGVLFGNGCSISDVLEIKTGTDSWVKVRNGLDTEGMIISQARAFHDGGGWGTTHDGGTVRAGISITASDVIVQNCRADTTTGATGEAAVSIGTNAAQYTLRLLQVVDSEEGGLQDTSGWGTDGLIEGCTVLDADVHAIRISSPRVRIYGNHVALAGSAGISLSGTADNSVIVANVVQSTSGTEIAIDAAAEDVVAVANRVFGTSGSQIDDESGTSVVTYNDLGTATCAVTGTVISEQPAGLLDSEIVTGGKTLIFTLSNATFRDLGTDYATNWKALFSSAAAGDWDTEEGTILAEAAFSLDATETVMTITLQAAASYENGGNETINIANLTGGLSGVLASEDSITPDNTSFVITNT